MYIESRSSQKLPAFYWFGDWYSAVGFTTEDFTAMEFFVKKALLKHLDRFRNKIITELLEKLKNSQIVGGDGRITMEGVERRNNIVGADRRITKDPIIVIP